MIQKWLYEHSPWFTGSAATVAVASDPHTTSSVVGIANGVLIPVIAFACNYFLVNVTPKIQKAVLDWQEVKGKRRLSTVGGQLASLQVQLAASTASTTAKDELILQLHAQIAEERKAVQAKLEELSRQLVRANDQLRTNNQKIEDVQRKVSES